jgi:hypothetical protein
VIVNLTPVPRPRYRIGLPRVGKWLEVLNTDAAIYGGSNMGNMGSVTAEEKRMHNQPASAEFTLPPLSIIAFRPEKPKVVEPIVETSVSNITKPAQATLPVAVEPVAKKATAPAPEAPAEKPRPSEKKPSNPGTQKTV